MPNGEEIERKFSQQLSLVSNIGSRVGSSLRREILTLGDLRQGCCSSRKDE